MQRSLVERARSGDRPAFEDLVRTRLDGVMRNAYAILGDHADAQDVTQEAFIAAWRSLGSLQDVDRFDAWLGRIVANACRMQLRRRRMIRGRSGPLPDDVPDAPPATGLVTGSVRFDAAFARLPLEQRLLLVGRHLEDRSVAEIAAELGVPEGTVKSRLFAARVALRVAFDEEEAR